MGRDAEIVGVDASEEMIEVARANVHDPRARFEVVAAASFRSAAPGTFDRVLCNAAFWQFPAPAPVLRAVAEALEPEGLFVFNAPAERVVSERAAGLGPASRVRRIYEGRQKELARLMSIPSMIGPLACGLSEYERDEVLAEAPVAVPWIYFVSRKRSISATHTEPEARNG